MNLKHIFKAHPEADEVIEVNGTPFVEETHATNYASDCGAKMIRHSRKDFEAAEEKRQAKIDAETASALKKAEAKAKAEQAALAKADKAAKAKATKEANAKAKAEAEAKAKAEVTTPPVTK